MYRYAGEGAGGGELEDNDDVSTQLTEASPFRETFGSSRGDGRQTYGTYGNHSPSVPHKTEINSRSTLNGTGHTAVRKPSVKVTSSPANVRAPTKY